MSGSKQLNEMESYPIARAREVVVLLYERNQIKWDELDREVVFAIQALVAAYLNKK
jgi:hypothetical protein